MDKASSLFLIGTVHGDLYGYKKLYHLLTEKKPNVITVEISPYSQSFRAMHAQKIRQILRANLRQMQIEDGLPLKEIISHGAIMSILVMLKDPYEWRAAESYAQKNEVTLLDIDLSVYAQEKLAHIEELVSLKNLKNLIKLPPSSFSDEIRAQYSKANYFFHYPPKFWPVNQEILEREKYMAEKIRQIYKSLAKGLLCHIGGWEHLVERPDGKSLYHLLQDLNPQRIILPNL